MVAISVIVATRKPDAELVPRHLLAADEFDDYELVVCREPGVCRARNAGIARARADKLVFLDDDSRPLPGYLAAASAALDRWPVVAGNTVHPHDDIFARYFTPHYSQGDEAGPLNPRYHPIACNMAYRREVFDAVGGFDEGFDPWGHEEKELAARVRERFPIHYDPAMRVEHPYADSLFGYWNKQYRLERRRPYFWTTQGISRRRQWTQTVRTAVDPRSYVGRSLPLTVAYAGRTVAWTVGRIEGLLRTPPNRHRVAIVGTGPTPGNHDGEGAGMAYRHAAGYRRLPNCELVACADIVPEHARRFAERVGIPESGVFTDYRTMLAEARPDVVSICVPPAAHAELVLGCAEAPSVRAIHCEKPMATTWADCTAMVEACEAAGVQLTFNHQRRFAAPVRRAKKLLDERAIGDLREIAVGGPNLFDFGTHLFDLCGLYTDGAAVEFVEASVTYDRENRRYGVPNETRAVARWRDENGVVGAAITGDDSTMDCLLRLVGSDGVLELGCTDGTSLRLRRHDDTAWTVVDTGGETIHGPRRGFLAAIASRFGAFAHGDPTPRLFAPTLVERAIADVVRTLDGRVPSTLSGQHALAATEVVYACWESARRGRVVTLPIDVTGNPLVEMLDDGRFDRRADEDAPAPTGEST